ncbi:TlpA family protein disulfide reductase [Flavitalea flava]
MHLKFLFQSLIGLLLLCHSLTVHALEGKLTLSPRMAQAGKTIRFSYLLSDKDRPTKDLSAALFYYSPNEINTNLVLDISLQDQGAGLYKGAFVLPKDAIAFALVFRSGESFDNNQGNGYIYPTYSAGLPVKGSNAGLALFYAYGTLLGLKEQSDKAISLFQQSKNQYPVETLPFEHHYYRLLVLKNKDAAFPVLERRAKGLLNRATPSLTDYQLAMTLYQLNNDFHTTDSILLAGSKKYPGSDLAIRQWDKEFNQYDSIPNMVRIFTAFPQKFNVGDLSGKPAETYAFWSSFIAYRFLLRKDYTNAIYYTEGINTPRLLPYRITFLDMIAAAMLDSHSVDTLLTDSLALAALESLKTGRDNPALHKFRNESSVDFLKRFEEGTAAPAMDLYARVLAFKGNYKEALLYQEKVMAIQRWSNPVFNEHYIEYLVKCGQFKIALEKSTKIFATGNSNPRIRTYMQQAYQHENGSDSGFIQLLSAVEDPIKNRLRDSLAQQQLAVESFPLTLPDMQGRQISLESLRGKVVIIDFWSTWCTPCKAAFPTLQRAVDLYKKDTGVVFLFVDTWEVVPQENRLKLINNLMSSKNYTLPVLLDQCKDLESRSYLVSSLYDIKGLPTKLVINTRGQIQFRNIGFDGNEDKLMNEINEMIRMARN